MRSPIRVLLALCFLLSCFVCVFAQNESNSGAAGSVAGAGEEALPSVKGGVATLYALDPLAQSLCLRDAGPGLVFSNHEVRNRCSDINFNGYYAEHFAVGIEGRRLGSIVDLGTAADLKREYGYEETVGGGQGFASVHLADGKVMILKDRRAQSMQELKEATALFGQATSVAKAPVKVGHVYLARISDGSDKNFQVVVKLLVIGYAPGESVTFRWQAL